MSLIAELKRRKVFKVGATYLIVAWLAIQAASIGLPAFDAPSWALRVFILVALLGFPVALVMAWILDATPEGVRFDPALSGNKRVFAVAGVLVLLALSWFFFGQPAIRQDAAVKPAAPVAAHPAPAKSIAVLPFENLSGDAENAYFVSGM